MTKTIKIKYFTDKIEKLAYIGGKSDWVDLRSAEDVTLKKGEFKRTSNRHDYALKPYGRTVLDALKDAGYDVISVGKIQDIFDG